MRSVSRWLVAGLLVSSLPAAAAAQREVGPHQGFWIGFGLGAGRNLTEDGNGDQLMGGGGYLRMGGTPNGRFLLGGEALGWFRSESNNVTSSRGNVSLVLMFYPMRSGGFFLKGGVGGASIITSATVGNTTISTTDTGLGETLGLGFDIRLARNFYLTPNIDFLFQQIEGGVKNTIGLVTIGATWH